MLPQSKRIKFTKTGNLMFISHLDLCRTMRSAFLRAKVPIYYSEGFNPHPKMVFALPLSIGTRSVCEYLDIKITEDMSREDIKDALNRSLPNDIRILEVYDPQSKFTDIAWAEYEIGCGSGVDISALDRDEIVVLKKTKSGDKNVDIKPQIRSYSYDGETLRVALDCTSANYLNPEYICSLLGLSDYSILRRRVLLADGVTEFR